MPRQPASNNAAKEKTHNEIVQLSLPLLATADACVYPGLHALHDRAGITRRTFS